MDEQRRDFLAGAALSQNQDRDVGASHKPALGFDLFHALGGPDKRCVLIQGDFLGLIFIFGRCLDCVLEELLHSQIDIALPERLEDYVGGAHPRRRHHLLQLGCTGKQDDRKRRPGSAKLRQQAKCVLPGEVPANVPIHQQQARLGRLPQAPEQLRGLGKQAHAEALRKDPVKVIQDCRIWIQSCDLRLALALRLHWRSWRNPCKPVSFPSYEAVRGIRYSSPDGQNEDVSTILAVICRGVENKLRRPGVMLTGKRRRIHSQADSKHILLSPHSTIQKW